MNCNIGKMDKILRLVLGLALIGIGTFAGIWWLAVVGIIPIATALIGFCPLYPLLGINTGCKSGEETTEA